jgi:hypothetical protein
MLDEMVFLNALRRLSAGIFWASFPSLQGVRYRKSVDAREDAKL